jgi:hypothetical protein
MTMKRNRILYSVLFISSLIFIYFFGGKIPFMLFNVVIVLPIFSAIYMVIIFLRFKYIQEIDKKFVVKGDNVKFFFKVFNEDILLYPYISISFHGSDTIFTNQFQEKSFSISPFKQKSYAFELKCNYRGCYDIGIKSVDIIDFLGIFKLSYKIFDPKVITIYPRIIPLDRFKLSAVYMSETNSLLNNWFNDTSTISDIRDYTYGDTIRKIHWKITAKMNKLMVKSFQSTCETCATLFLDLHKNPYSFDINTMIEDKVIEAIVSVLHYSLSNWIPLNLVYFKDKIINLEAKSPLEFEEIYKLFSKITFTEKFEVKDMLDVYTQNSIQHTNVIIFTSNLDYALYNQLYKTKFSGHDVSLIYVSPFEVTGIRAEETENILSNLPEIGIRTYKLDISNDIKLVLER